MRRPLAVSFVLLILPILSLLAACSIDVNYTATNDKAHAGSENWMAGLDDSLPVASVVIPGTHDTCANYDFLCLSSVSATQDLTLEEQLQAGVRCIDIRIYNDNGVYRIHHGPQYMYMTLENVVDTCREFLEKNPSEFIVMLAQGEYRTPVNGITRIVDEMSESDPVLFWQGTDANGCTVGEVRGRVIPVLRYSDSSRTACLDTGVYTELGCRYKTTNPAQSWETAKGIMISNADGPVPFCPVSVFTACYFEGQFGIPNIRSASSCINRELSDWLSGYSGSGKHFGIIVTDHISRDLAFSIYSCNNLGP